MGTLSISIFAFFAAMTNALQSRVNGAASVEVGNPVVAAMMSVGGGFILSTLILLSNPKLRALAVAALKNFRKTSLRPWQFFAGMGGGVFIFGQALVVPAFGVSIYIIAVVAGQTVASLFVDKYGIGPGGRRAITGFRVASAALATLGVIVSAFGRSEVSYLLIPALAMGIFSGAITAVQYALNGKISREFKSTFLTSSLNFFMGFCLLSAILLFSSLLQIWTLKPAPNIFEHPNLWGGGALGLIFIASAAYFVGRLGVLRFAVVSVLGQLTGALLLDVFAPARGTVLTWFVPAGLLITLIAVLVGNLRRRVSN